MVYFAMIGDMKSSKALNNRKEIQDELKTVLDNVNERYRESIAASFLITLGDEFQGLLTHSDRFMEIVKYIQREIHPVKIRIGVGIGEITTRIHKEAAIGADGPAFYAARNAISMIREAEKKIKKQAPDILMQRYNVHDFEIIKINTMLSLIKTIEDGWTEKQRYTIWDMMAHPGSQEACALRMNTSQSTVARRLADGKYVVYVDALKTIGEAVCKLEESCVV